MSRIAFLSLVLMFTGCQSSGSIEVKLKSWGCEFETKIVKTDPPRIAQDAPKSIILPKDEAKPVMLGKPVLKSK